MATAKHAFFSERVRLVCNRDETGQTQCAQFGVRLAPERLLPLPLTSCYRKDRPLSAFVVRLVYYTHLRVFFFTRIIHKHTHLGALIVTLSMLSHTGIFFVKIMRIIGSFSRQ